MTLAGALLQFLTLLQTTPVDAPQMRAALFASQTAAAPGASIELAIEIEVTKGWHYYHPILLDTGMTTAIELTLPPGVSAGTLRYPKPTLGTVLGQEYLGYEGRIAVLTTLDVPRNVEPGTSLEIRAAVRGLACIEACVPVEAEASLTLPVAAEPGEPAGVELFERARRALPRPLADAPYIQGSRLAVSHARLPIGGRGELAAIIRVEDGHHIQDRDPGVDLLVPSRLFIESIDGIKIDLANAVWPPAHLRELPGIGKVREQSGEVVVRVPMEIIDRGFEPGPVRLRTLFQFQACNDAGQCFPPAMAEGWFEFEVVPAGSTAEPSGDAVFASATIAAGAPPPPRASGGDKPLWFVFLGAFLGGVILNVMPCVLPVISLKIFSFMQQAGESRARVLQLGLYYAAGILASFAVLAVVLVSVGLAWGGVMQYAPYVTVLTAVIFAFALSLLGVWELRVPGVVENVAGAVTTREGAGGAFLNGLMATALATPCTGPLLGPAVGAIVKLPPWLGAACVMTVGVGLAAPYVLLTAFPGWLRFLPRPGRWMVTFKQVMGFVLLFTVIWLLWTLRYLVEPDDLIATLAFLVCVGAACWVVGSVGLSARRSRELAAWAGSAAIVVIGWFGSFRLLGATPTTTEPAATGAAKAMGGESEWLPWAKGLPEVLSRQGYTVYVDFTAKWCATCQVNKATVLKVDPVRARREALGVVMVEADFTRPNGEIQSELRRFERAGVPLNVIYPAGRPDDVIVLPEFLTSGIVLEALERAGPSRSARPPATASR